MRYAPGVLVKLVDVPDRSLYIKTMYGSLGVLINEVENARKLWQVLVQGNIVTLHELDFELLIEKTSDGD
jgi:hypothetical protein